MAFTRGLPSSRMLHNPTVRRKHRLDSLRRQIVVRHRHFRSAKERLEEKSDPDAKRQLDAEQKVIRRMVQDAQNLKARIFAR